MKISVLDYLKLRVLSCYQEAVMLKEGKMPAPRMAILYPTYVCNHNCIGCDYIELNKKGKTLNKEEFDNIVVQLVKLGIKSVEFCGGGEPTLNPNLPNAIKKFIENNVSFGILTNGTNLTDELQELLVKHGSYCRISVESATETIFNKYKRPKNLNSGFKTVIQNIEKLVNLRNKFLTKTKLQVSFKYCFDKNNIKDAFNAIELAYNLKIDSIQFKLIRNMPSEIMNKKIINRLKKRFIQIKREYPDFRVIDDLEKSKLNMRCWLSPLQITIDPYGDVYICCYYRHRANKHKLGNLFQNSLKDIWYSQEHWYKINSIDISDCNKYDCRFHFYNELMWKLVVEDIAQLSFI